MIELRIDTLSIHVHESHASQTENRHEAASFKERYEAVRRGVEALARNLDDPIKVEAIGYVLSLFHIQDEDSPVDGPVDGSPSRLKRKVRRTKSGGRSDAMRKAWEKRKAEAALKAEALLNER